MEFAVDLLVAAAAEDLKSGSNAVIPAPANTVFTHSDEHGTVGWLPHPRLTDSLRNDLTVAVGRSPRAWLSLFCPKTVNCLTSRSTPLLACKAIHSPQGFGVKGQGMTHNTEELLVHPPWL
jgi:hypothetical protein